MGLLWISKAFVAKPPAKEPVPLVGSMTTEEPSAWFIERQGTAGYFWQVYGDTRHAFDAPDPYVMFGLTPGFYQAVINSYYFARDRIQGHSKGFHNAWPSAAVGPYIVTAGITMTQSPYQPGLHRSAGYFTAVWPTGVMEGSYWFPSPLDSKFTGWSSNQSPRYWGYKLPPQDPKEAVEYDEHVQEISIGTPLWSYPEDERLGALLVGLQFLAGKSMGKMLEGKP